MDILRYHKLTDKDQNSPRLEYFTEEKRATTNAQLVEVQHTFVPRDVILVVQSWVIESADNGANVLGAVFHGSTGTVAGGDLILEPLDALFYEAERQKSFISIKKELIIMPNEAPYAYLYHGLADANNTIFSRIRGWYIPKGNLGVGFGA